MGKSLRQANDYWQDQPDCYELIFPMEKRSPGSKNQPKRVFFHRKIALTKKRISSFSLYSVNHTGAQSLPDFIWKNKGNKRRPDVAESMENALLKNSVVK